MKSSLKVTENSKSRRWGLILWLDNQDNVKALEYIKRHYDNFIYVLHDQDTYDEDIIEDGIIIHKKGDLKKAHYHVLLYFPNQKKVSTLINQLNIQLNNIYPISSFTGQLRYLVHYDDEDKFQYPRSCVKGSLYMLSKFNKSFALVTDETEMVGEIYQFIYSNYCNTLQDLLTFVLDNDLYSCFRRNYSLFKDLLYGVKYAKRK